MFQAPTEEIELKIVNYCMDTLRLPFGEFWYAWFPTHAKNRNQTAHIECNVDNLEDTIRETFSNVVEVEKFYKIQKNPLPSYCEHRYQYFIHFKTTIQL